MTPRRRLGPLLLSTLLAAGLATVPLASPAVAGVDDCAATTGDDDFYPGPSASEVYDQTFSQGPAIPDLPRYTPQGLTTWPNWDGDGHDLLVLGAYWKGHRSRLYGIEPATGKRVGSVYIAESHVGGLAIAGGWLFAQNTQGNRNGSVRKYRLTDLRKKLLADGTPYLGRYGSTQNVYSAEFMTSYNGRVWSGHYRSSGPDKMYEYSVSSTGRLSAIGSSWKVPAKTQGVMITSNRFVFSSSDGYDRGRLRVTERRRDYTDGAGRCFRSPSMSEGITASGGKAYIAYEGGSSLYRDSARNVVLNLHKASIGTLGALSTP